MGASELARPGDRVARRRRRGAPAVPAALRRGRRGGRAVGRGGAAGERERPLLRCDADWDALGDGLYSLCHDFGEAEAIQLLGVLDAAGAFDEVLALRGSCSSGCGWAGRRSAWTRSPRGCRWRPSSTRGPEPPAVAMTWLELEPRPAPRTPVELERFADWVRLAEILHQHDPELLRGLELPGALRRRAGRFADQRPRDEPRAERDLRIETLGPARRLDARRVARHGVRRPAGRGRGSSSWTRRRCRGGRGVPGRAGAAGPMRGWLRSAARRTLPRGVFGSSSAKSTMRGYLYGAVWP